MTSLDFALRTVAATSLIAAFAVTPALADPSGFIAISGGYDGLEVSESDGIDGSAIRVLASGVYMFTPVLGLQGDVKFGWRSFNDELNAELSSLDGALHGFYRKEDHFLVGGFFQIGSDSLSGYDADISDTRSYVGAEGQLYFDNLTLYGQTGLVQDDYESGSLTLGMDGWFGTLEARYFLTPDFRIDGHVGLAIVEPDIAWVPRSTLNFGIGAEYQLENLPVSLFASYDYFSTSYDDFGYDFNEHRIMVGAKFAIGEESLFARDRSGASLKPVDNGFWESFPILGH